jgi:hypothetical protein
MHIDPDTGVLLHCVKVCYCTFAIDLYALEIRLLTVKSTNLTEAEFLCQDV